MYNNNTLVSECLEIIGKTERLQEDFYKIEEISLINFNDDKILKLKDELENLLVEKINILKDKLESKIKKLKKNELVFLLNR